jgi:hypothetical protein
MYATQLPACDNSSGYQLWMDSLNEGNLNTGVLVISNRVFGGWQVLNSR